MRTLKLMVIAMILLVIADHVFSQDTGAVMAQEYLQKPVIKMTAKIRDVSGKPKDLDVEVYPQECKPREDGKKECKMQTFKSTSYCETGAQKAVVTNTPEGYLLISRPPRMHGCGHLHILVLFPSKNIKVYVSESESFDDPRKRNTNNSWTLDN